MKTCRKCDLNYEDSKNFCKNCGSALENLIKLEPKTEAKNQVFEEKLKTDPLNALLLKEYAQFLYENKIFEKASSISLKLIAIDEKDRQAKEILFDSYLHLENYEKAMEVGEEIYNAGKTDISFIENLAIAFQNAGHTDRAVDFYDQILEIESENNSVAYRKAMALLIQNKPDYAIPVFEELFDKGETDQLIVLYAGVGKAIRNDFDTAVEILSTALTNKDIPLTEPHNVIGSLYLAYALSNTVDNPQTIDQWINSVDLDVLKSNQHQLHDHYLANTISNVYLLKLHQLDHMRASAFHSEIKKLTSEYLYDPDKYFPGQNWQVYASLWYATALKQESFGFYSNAIVSMEKCVNLEPDNESYDDKLDHLKHERKKIASKKKKRLVIFSSVVISVIFITVGGYFFVDYYQDRQAWNNSRNEDTYDAYVMYLRNFHGGRFEENVKAEIFQIRDKNPSIALSENMQFQEIIIGDQVWMSENLNVTNFRNGDRIFYAGSTEEWEQAGINGVPAWCYYANDPINGLVFGKLYNWYALMDPRGLAPEGWRIPSDSDWRKLTSHLGRNAGKMLKSKKGWKDRGNGSNSSGLTARPGGIRDVNSFNYMGERGLWWSNSVVNGEEGNSFSLFYKNDHTSFIYNKKLRGLSVRCLKGDSQGQPASGTNTHSLEKRNHGADLYIRNKPDGNVIRKISAGEQFEVLSINSNHQKIQLSDGTTGYIKNSGVSDNHRQSNVMGIYPQASLRLLKDDDLKGLSKSDLRIMRNEIFARYGYIFRTTQMKNYFEKQSWYKPAHADVTNRLTELEKQNIQLIQAYE